MCIVGEILVHSLDGLMIGMVFEENEESSILQIKTIKNHVYGLLKRRIGDQFLSKTHFESRKTILFANTPS